MRLFNPEHKRVWHRSVDREYDIYDVIQILDVRPARHYEAPMARAYVRRPGRGAGPTIWVGPGNSPFAGTP